MSMHRSDLPHVSALPVSTQRMAIDAMWQAYNKAELRGQFSSEQCPVTYVATMVELLEAALNVVQELDFPGQVEALRQRAEARGLGDWAEHHIRPSGEPYMAQMWTPSEEFVEAVRPISYPGGAVVERNRTGSPQHPHNAPERWRDDGKCIWKSCRHWRTVAEFESHWRQITSTNDIPPGEYILAGLCPEHRGYRLLPDGQCPVPSGITPGIGHTPGAS